MLKFKIKQMKETKECMARSLLWDYKAGLLLDLSKKAYGNGQPIIAYRLAKLAQSYIRMAKKQLKIAMTVIEKDAFEYRKS